MVKRPEERRAGLKMRVAGFTKEQAMRAACSFVKRDSEANEMSVGAHDKSKGAHRRASGAK